MFNFIRNYQTIFQSRYCFAIPTSMYENFNCCTSLLVVAHLWYYSFKKQKVNAPHVHPWIISVHVSKDSSLLILIHLVPFALTALQCLLKYDFCIMYPFFFLVKTAGAIIYQYLISFFLEEKIGDGIISYFTISV